MITRTTSSMMTQAALRNLQGNLNGLANLQQQATSQKVLGASSDDPVTAGKILGVHAEQARNDQYARNVTDALAWVTTVDTALTSVTSLLGRARDLTLQGANSGAMGVESREAIATELDSIRAELLGQANTKVLGRSVFAGTSNQSAFSSADYSFSGAPGSEVNRRVSGGETVRVDVDGSTVFGEGADSVFALIDSIAADLRAGVNVGSRIGELDDRLSAVLGTHGAVGSRQSQIERARDATVGASVDLETRRTEIEDVDALDVLVKLQSAQLVYQTAMQVTARVQQTSLMEFIR